jgi:CDP-diacylglycerol--glycerol-3-phosphate 3-phosphatidyltransferase
MELKDLYSSILALLIFMAASITDFLDGQIARKNKTITPLGIFLDPLADKLLITSAFICFVDIPIIGVPAWMVITIIAREFLITGLRSIAALKNIIIASDRVGKFKTTFQIIVISLIITVSIINEVLIKFSGVTLDTFRRYNNDFYATLALILKKTPFWATLVIVVFTVYSGLNYMWKYRKILSEK